MGIGHLLKRTKQNKLGNKKQPAANKDGANLIVLTETFVTCSTGHRHKAKGPLTLVVTRTKKAKGPLTLVVTRTKKAKGPLTLVVAISNFN